MEIATGQREEECEPQAPKDKAAAELGRKGGKARADKLTPSSDLEITKRAAAKRWKGQA